ncbi:MAG: YceI family protein [Myxococcales bacterium]|nr:YceI family protein [Myxococcales bacterium]
MRRVRSERRLAAAPLGLLLCACASAPTARLVTEVPAPVAVPDNAETYELPAGSIDVQADVSAGTSYTLKFPRSRATLVIAPSKLEASSVDVHVDTTAVDSTLPIVADIAKDQFLHTYRFPTARFASRSLRRAETGLELYGNFDFHGTQKSLVVPASIEVDSCRVRIGCEFAIDRRAFGAVSDGSLDGIVSDSVVVRIAADVARKGAPASCSKAEARGEPLPAAAAAPAAAR